MAPPVKEVGLKVSLEDSHNMYQNIYTERVSLMRCFGVFAIILLIALPAVTVAESQILKDEQSIYAIIKDSQGDRVEGLLRLNPSEITVTTRDNKEKAVPLKIIESIKLEKMTGAIPGADQPGAESYYSVRLQNSQEIFRLRNKYTVILNTKAGVLTRTIDPETIQDSPSKEPSPSVKSETSRPFLRDKSIILSLEIKF